jgi:rubrerythrin
MGKELTMQNGDVIDAIDKRCNCCGWTGTDDDHDGGRCPNCGHGLTDYSVRPANER